MTHYDEFMELYKKRALDALGKIDWIPQTEGKAISIRFCSLDEYRSYGNEAPIIGRNGCGH